MKKLSRTAVMRELKTVVNIFNANFEDKIKELDYNEGILMVDGKKIDCTNMSTVDDVVNALQAYIWIMYY